MNVGQSENGVNESPYTVHVLYDGYSKMVSESEMEANGTCTLIKGRLNLIVDTMTPWDKDVIVTALGKHGVNVNQIDYVISTHSHSDHTGNNNLFLKAKHIVGFSISYKHKYTIHPFDEGKPYVIDKDISIIPTPGHTHDDVSVVVNTKNQGTVAVVGDLFEREEDLEDPELWRTVAGSQSPERQEENRNKVLRLANYIVPGHGPMFRVTDAMKKKVEL
ncbi:metallo-beta-lactamase domain-containing protein 1-like isoform X1 [Macrosteles quadrilineatus]|uniref:metallo-beta-lactamase domain-containing protein 1-like isoform X1 n=1 Tax=Macrosteles quadrilineatus TaxID=74068 RepID=UPI0023E26D9D|nr:metallo-beta-lactamase domain-containing protein 1-like isoform X1 [Macrosteles quadrilineatus]